MLSYNYNAVQSVVGPSMNPGFKRLRNNSQAERIDSRSSYTNEPFRPHYNAQERATEWHPGGMQSPNYSHGSQYQRPKNSNFHSRVNLN